VSKAFTNIDLARLEEEWLMQPKLYDKYSSKLADAKLDLAEAKSEQEWVIADVKRRLRKNPQKYGLSKTTDAIIKEASVLHPLWRKAEKAVNEAAHRVDVLNGIINTLEHRKRTLENLVTLFGQSYFSKPKVKREVQSKLVQLMNETRRKGGTDPEDI
jgi:hypothetical protein